MSHKSDDYRRRAAECETLARQLRFDAERQIYDHMARRWRKMAEQADYSAGIGLPVCTKNLNPDVVVMKSAKDSM